MPKNEKQKSHVHQFQQAAREASKRGADTGVGQMVDGEEIEENEKWNPTPEVFEAFLVRDAELCAGNLRMVLASRSPLSLKELKDSTLHSSHVVERQVDTWLQSGILQESKGKYALVAAQRGPR